MNLDLGWLMPLWTLFQQQPLAQGIGLAAMLVGISAFRQRDDGRFRLRLCLYQAAIALHFFLMGAGTAALSAGLIAAADLQQLALLWTQGGEIPWHALGHNTGAALIPLPTYAFDKQRYWLEQPSAVKALHEPLTAAASTHHVVGQKPLTAAEQGRQLLADLLGMQPQDLSPTFIACQASGSKSA